jgi:dihydrofolate synthase/folylpolyglutamate synthase
MLHDPAAERLAPLLSQLENFERSRPDKRLWDLANAKALLAPIGAAPQHGKAVQVGGSKGKGTVCAFLGAFGQAAGLRTGAYLSPHVVTILERILLDGRQISVDAMETQLRLVLARAGQLGIQATFFEAITVAAVQAFVAARTQLSIYEVGLGGRFDATTAIPVDASILTGVELEHTAVLGSTVAAIAAEKSWIMRPSGVAFTAARGDALAVAENHAKSCGAKLFVLGTDIHLVDASWEGADYRARLVLQDGSDRPVFLPDARGFEPQALALAAAAFLHLHHDAHLQLDPAPRPWQLPCRFDIARCHDGMPFVFDGAHTEQSMHAVAAEFRRRWPDRKAVVLFASAVDKRWRQGLSAVLPIADSFVLTELTSAVGEDPQVIAEWLRAQGAKASVIRSIPDALDAVCQQQMPRLCCGSFYLAGEARALLASRAER